jgi:hypothetical protein
MPQPFYPDGRMPIPIKQEKGRDPELIWTFQRTEKLPAAAVIRTTIVKQSSIQTHFNQPNKVSMLYQTW